MTSEALICIPTRVVLSCSSRISTLSDFTSESISGDLKLAYSISDVFIYGDKLSFCLFEAVLKPSHSYLKKYIYKAFNLNLPR